MPKTLDDVLPALKRRLSKSAPGLYEKLDEHFSTVAAELEVLRQKQHITQRELAKRTQIHQAEVSRILSGRTQPRVGTAERLARALGAELRVVPRASGRVRRRR
ncbi:MAG TPA: helix-turn-helix transcriptional regulator [Myxococcales bacterium]|nr:helix-turn-helix transcriptional regulator [Myxococcales bacterium]